MKLLLALAFLTAVCAIPHPGQNAAPSPAPALLVPQVSGLENNQIVNPQGVAPGEQPEIETLEESDEDDGDEDGSGQEPSLKDLINALNSIREAIRKKIHNNEDSEEDIYVPTESGPADEVSSYRHNAISPPRIHRSEGPRNSTERPLNTTQASSNNTQGVPRPGNNTGEVPPSNDTQGNDTAPPHRPLINITQIQKEIHDKIDNIIANILRPWLGINNATGNGTDAPPQQGNNTADSSNNGNSSAANVTRPQPGNNATDATNGNATTEPNVPQGSTSTAPNVSQGANSSNNQANVTNSSNEGNQAVAVDRSGSQVRVVNNAIP